MKRWDVRAKETKEGGVGIVTLGIVQITLHLLVRFLDPLYTGTAGCPYGTNMMNIIQ